MPLPLLPRRQPRPPARANAASCYWFKLGREPLLSAAELAAVLNLAKENFELSGDILSTRLNNLDALEIIKRLGGTIKIAAELAKSLSETELTEAIVKELLTVEGKIQFGISLLSLRAPAGSVAIPPSTADINFIEKLGKTIKNKLKDAGRSVRFVFNNEAELSSVSVEKNGLTKRGREFVVASPPLLSKERSVARLEARGQVRFAVAKTLAVQPFEEWGKRDFGRPGRDDVSGMLPPKLALIMVNLTVGQVSDFGFRISDFQILDPFCGSGTILTEAALMGCTNLIGSDISEKAVVDTKQNLEWTQSQLSPTSYKLPANILRSDIHDLSNHLPAQSVDAIVTEPYLGPPLKGNESVEQIKKNCAELSGLYKIAFGEFKKVLKPGGTVIFIIPRYTIHGIRYTISDKIMADLKLLGFEKQRLLSEELSKPYYLIYHRPGQFAAREVWKFGLLP